MNRMLSLETLISWEPQKESLPQGCLPQAVEKLSGLSLRILNTQIDWKGGIIAGKDSDVIEYNRDTYS